ncbi:MAG: thioredoxin [Clostridia bacterium]|nr:thioredoxin [Clostridia bacterium]MBR4087048.1 thioredoxin [Clostridia bacterium]
MAALKINKETFDKEVLQSEKPVLLDFFATWCGPCKLLAPVLDQIAEEHPEIKVCKVDVDENQELAAQFQVMSIPTLFVIKDGKVTAQAVGARSKKQLLEMMEK